MTIEEIRSGDSLQLNIAGKVDAISAPELQNEVLKSFQKSRNVIMNFADVTYISSAGLRALLIGQKTASSKGGKFLVINCNDSIKDVLRVTGLDKVLTIQ
ncbi:MAG: STAS domain-containing protein [Butyrivibrio sp.]|nr:STAS domain-containing protein [Butyrivibrio sp.]